MNLFDYLFLVPSRSNEKTSTLAVLLLYTLLPIASNHQSVQFNPNLTQPWTLCVRIKTFKKKFLSSPCGLPQQYQQALILVLCPLKYSYKGFKTLKTDFKQCPTVVFQPFFSLSNPGHADKVLFTESPWCFHFWVASSLSKSSSCEVAGSEVHYCFIH